MNEKYNRYLKKSNHYNLLISAIAFNQEHNRIYFSFTDSIITITHAYESIYRTGEFDEIVISDYLNKVIKPILVGHDITLNLEAEPINLLAYEGIVSELILKYFHYHLELQTSEARGYFGSSFLF